MIIDISINGARNGPQGNQSWLDQTVIRIVRKESESSHVTLCKGYSEFYRVWDLDDTKITIIVPQT